MARIPDSLTNLFKTKHGREVRDGGGITPDVKIEWDKMNRLTYNIIRDLWAFNYANRFYATTPSIASAEEFVITDSIFNDFKKFIDPDKFQYDKVCETMLGELRKTAEAEGYMNDETKAQFDALEGLLRHNLDKDLDNNRKAINEILSDEIVGRYYYQKGQVIDNLKYDEALDRAAAILNDPQAYRKILSPAEK